MERQAAQHMHCALRLLNAGCGLINTRACFLFTFLSRFPARLVRPGC